MDPLTMSLIAAGGSAIGALPDIIPSKYERDQKKRLQEMQRKQEMGALGLTEQQRAAIEGQMRGARQQAQQYADAERARLTQPTAQPQIALLGQQMADESRQRLEADLASQILGLDLQRQQQQEQEIKDLQAAQAQYRRARAEGLAAPFQAGGEAYVGQMGIDKLLGIESQSPDLAFLNSIVVRGKGFLAPLIDPCNLPESALCGMVLVVGICLLLWGSRSPRGKTVRSNSSDDVKSQ